MAAKKSKEYPHQWPNGSWHSIPYIQHLQNEAAKAVKSQGTGAQIMAAGAAYYDAKGIPNPNAAPVPAAAPAAAGPAGTPAPVAPTPVDPFFTADDLDAINQFTTDLGLKLEGIDTDLKNLEIDTTYQKTQTDGSAKQATSGAQDDAISRGIFSSSIKDATIYDIEAQRSLSQKFLDDKLTSARLNAGSNKQILGTAKTNFDTNMATRKVQNAQGVNDTNNTAWSAALAAWQSNPLNAPAPAAAAPATPALKPAPTKGLPSTNTLFAPTPVGNKGTPSTSRPNVSTGSGSTKPKKKTTVVQYGNTP